jgi:DNA invertase Pin-like site-specific DNA recombinase
MFQVIGTMSEFERALIQERIIAGLENAVTHGKRLGRPRTVVDAAKVIALRSSGASWREVSQQMGIGVGTACRALQRPSKNLPESPLASA